MIVTIKPFGAIDRSILEHLQGELATYGRIQIALGDPIPESIPHRTHGGRTQYQASGFERACVAEPGDRVIAVTDVDLFERGLNFVFGHATIQDRYAVISIARLRDDGPAKLLDRTAKTAIHELGHTLGLYHDEKNPDCVMHFSERTEDTDRKGRSFCARCRPGAAFTLSRLGM